MRGTSEAVDTVHGTAWVPHSDGAPCSVAVEKTALSLSRSHCSRNIHKIWGNNSLALYKSFTGKHARQEQVAQTSVRPRLRAEYLAPK